MKTKTTTKNKKITKRATKAKAPAKKLGRPFGSKNKVKK